MSETENKTFNLDGNTKKYKLLTISDHPLSPSGVGTQTKYILEALLQTGKFEIISLGGAIKHQDYKPQKTEEYGDDWRIYPVDNYGNQDMVRSIVRQEKPDMLWFMTDPRFWGWLWEIEQELRPLMPMVYYHVWDNKPYPMYNKAYYESNDVIATISKVTSDIVQTVAPDVEEVYLPHAVDSDTFKKASPEDAHAFRTAFDDHHGTNGKVLFFWNNRNARRKQTGSLVIWFKDFLDEVGHDKASLILHTDPRDQYGQDLHAIIHDFDLADGQVLLSTDKIPPEKLALLYNIADCTINISDAEGFGLATLESLSCETPIIVNMTGGLQEQVTDGTNWFGVGIQPASKAIIGSQAVPYIYEDRVSREDFINALKKIFYQAPEARQALGAAGRKHVMKNYNFDDFRTKWINLITETCERHGSWDTRQQYKGYRFEEIAA
tara:strand:+ start:276 stop:1583 length:1308 start_codon:yes stop_codon:yes gene_type:complete